MSYPDPSTAEVNAMLEALELLTTRNIRMTGKATGAPYKAFITAGWTDEALIAHGHMECMLPVPAPRLPVVAEVKPDYTKPLPSYISRKSNTRTK
jgi:hypothetical protein